MSANQDKLRRDGRAIRRSGVKQAANTLPVQFFEIPAKGRFREVQWRALAAMGFQVELEKTIEIVVVGPLSLSLALERELDKYICRYVQVSRETVTF